MYETYRGGDDASRMGLALADQIAEFHQRRWGIAKSEECIRMFFYSETNASLGACDVLRLSHLNHSWVTQIAFRLNTQTRQCPLTDTTCHHRHICYDGLQ